MYDTFMPVKIMLGVIGRDVTNHVNEATMRHELIHSDFHSNPGELSKETSSVNNSSTWMLRLRIIKGKAEITHRPR